MSSSLHEPSRLPDPKIVEVGDGMFAYIQPDGSWWVNNAAFLVGRRGVVSIDACATERRTRAYLKAIGEVARKPVHTLVNTHHHGDHTYGNYLFDGATIIAHERCRQEVLAAGLPRFKGVWTGPEWGALELAPPFVTFSDGLDVYVDDLRCEVRHVGVAAHTTNDSVVWVPDRSVLFSGDLLFKGGTPFLLMGSLSGALRAVAGLRDYAAATIVPGHGEVCGPEVIGEVLGYLRLLDDVSRRGSEAGLSPLEAAREADLGAYGEWLDSERIVGNLHRAYAEVAGAAPGARIDVAAALADMIAYNGGRPLRCLA